jgi:hypothetical protein
MVRNSHALQLKIDTFLARKFKEHSDLPSLDDLNTLR